MHLLRLKIINHICVYKSIIIWENALKAYLIILFINYIFILLILNNFNDFIHKCFILYI